MVLSRTRSNDVCLIFHGTFLKSGKMSMNLLLYFYVIVVKWVGCSELMLTAYLRILHISILGANNKGLPSEPNLTGSFFKIGPLSFDNGFWMGLKFWSSVSWATTSATAKKSPATNMARTAIFSNVDVIAEDADEIPRQSSWLTCNLHLPVCQSTTDWITMSNWGCFIELCNAAAIFMLKLTILQSRVSHITRS